MEAKCKIERLIKLEKPDIVHLNNFAHQISPSILDVFRKHKISVVMTMHDYKMVCPAYSMFSNGKPCEKCKNGKYYQCFLKKCTKDSYIKSLLNTIEMYFHHKILHIYDTIDVFISPSKFLMNKVRNMGFKEQIVFLPNFVNIQDFQPSYEWQEESIVYVGRLSYEKGLETLLNAIKKININLKIIGDGPMKESLKFKVKREKINNVVFLEYRTGNELKDEIRNSMAMVLPSECYENNPRSVIESFALGKPVIGARIGGIPELVKDGETGFTFEPGNVNDLRLKIERLLENPDKIIEMGKKARKFAEENFGQEKHYQRLMEIYRMAIEGTRERW